MQAYQRIILCSSHVFKEEKLVQNCTSFASNHVTEVVSLEYTAENPMGTIEVEIIFITNVILVQEASWNFCSY